MKSHLSQQSASFQYLGAFESTKIHGSGNGRASFDILETSSHFERWQHDLELLNRANLRTLRYSAPWHRIEGRPNCFDFSWMDGPMGYMRDHGMTPIVDLLHHTSFPDWLTGGFVNAEFPALYARFVERFARRYPWVDQYTVFNEPIVTSILCGLTGTWYPHYRGDRHFVAMSSAIGKVICTASEVLRREVPGVKLIHVETSEGHRALDAKAEEFVEFANHRRFLFHDLMMGKIDRAHPLWEYLEGNGFDASELGWFGDHAASFDVLGLDYYAHSEMDWYWNGRRKRADIRFPVSHARGFASIARDYVDRFRAPIMLTETNLRGHVTDRITWLKFMQEQCEQLVEEGVDLRGFCWYPSVDCTDWSNSCTKCTMRIDPQGIWGLDARRWSRLPSELSEIYEDLARGRRSASDIPAYELQGPHDTNLAGFIHLMKHWEDWQVPGGAREAA